LAPENWWDIAMPFFTQALDLGIQNSTRNLLFISDLLAMVQQQFE